MAAATETFNFRNLALKVYESVTGRSDPQAEQINNLEAGVKKMFTLQPHLFSVPENLIIAVREGRLYDYRQYAGFFTLRQAIESLK